MKGTLTLTFNIKHSTLNINHYPTPLRAHALRYTHLSAYAASLRSVAPGSGLLFPRAGANAPAYWLPPSRALLFASLARGFLMFARKGELSCKTIMPRYHEEFAYAHMKVLLSRA